MKMLLQNTAKTPVKAGLHRLDGESYTERSVEEICECAYGPEREGEIK